MRPDSLPALRVLQALELFGPQARPYNFDMNQEAQDEMTDRLRDDGGAYLRLWHDRMRYFHKGLHARLLGGGAAEERDLVALRSITARRRRRSSRRRAGGSRRGRSPCRGGIRTGPSWAAAASRSGKRPGTCGDIGWSVTTATRRSRASRSPRRRCADGRYAVVVYARGAGGFSGSAVAPFLYRPAAGDPLLEYNPVRPRALHPDAGASVPPGVSAELAWEIAVPEQNQVKAAVAVFEDVGCLAQGAERVFACEQEGPDAAACRCAVLAAALRPGRSYYWYVTPTNAGGTRLSPPGRACLPSPREGE